MIGITRRVKNHQNGRTTKNNSNSGGVRTNNNGRPCIADVIQLSESSEECLSNKPRSSSPVATPPVSQKNPGSLSSFFLSTIFESDWNSFIDACYKQEFLNTESIFWCFKHLFNCNRYRVLCLSTECCNEHSVKFFNNPSHFSFELTESELPLSSYFVCLLPIWSRETNHISLLAWYSSSTTTTTTDDNDVPSPMTTTTTGTFYHYDSLKGLNHKAALKIAKRIQQRNGCGSIPISTVSSPLVNGKSTVGLSSPEQRQEFPSLFSEQQQSPSSSSPNAHSAIPFVEVSNSPQQYGHWECGFYTLYIGHQIITRASMGNYDPLCFSTLRLNTATTTTATTANNIPVQDQTPVTRPVSNGDSSDSFNSSNDGDDDNRSDESSSSPSPSPSPSPLLEEASASSSSSCPSFHSSSSPPSFHSSSSPPSFHSASSVDGEGFGTSNDGEDDGPTMMEIVKDDASSEERSIPSTISPIPSSKSTPLLSHSESPLNQQDTSDDCASLRLTGKRSRHASLSSLSSSSSFTKLPPGQKRRKTEHTTIFSEFTPNDVATEKVDSAPEELLPSIPPPPLPESPKQPTSTSTSEEERKQTLFRVLRLRRIIGEQIKIVTVVRSLVIEEEESIDPANESILVNDITTKQLRNFIRCESLSPNIMEHLLRRLTLDGHRDSPIYFELISLSSSPGGDQNDERDYVAEFSESLQHSRSSSPDDLSSPSPYYSWVILVFHDQDTGSYSFAVLERCFCDDATTTAFIKCHLYTFSKGGFGSPVIKKKLVGYCESFSSVLCGNSSPGERNYDDDVKSSTTTTTSSFLEFDRVFVPCSSLPETHLVEDLFARQMLCFWSVYWCIRNSSNIPHDILYRDIYRYLTNSTNNNRSFSGRLIKSSVIQLSSRIMVDSVLMDHTWLPMYAIFPSSTPVDAQQQQTTPHLEIHIAPHQYKTIPKNHNQSWLSLRSLWEMDEHFIRCDSTIVSPNGHLADHPSAIPVSGFHLSSRDLYQLLGLSDVTPSSFNRKDVSKIILPIATAKQRNRFGGR